MIFIRGKNLTDSIISIMQNLFERLKKFTFAKKLTFDRYCKKTVLEYC